MHIVMAVDYVLVIVPTLETFACPEIRFEPHLHNLTSLCHCLFASCVDSTVLL